MNTTTLGTTTLLPDPEHLTLQYMAFSQESLSLVARTRGPTALCPLCGCPSQRVHSRYLRTLADLPWGGVAMCLLLWSRRFFCDTPSCARRIFTEPVPAVAQRYAHRTKRLQYMLHWIGYCLGGEAGARLAAELAMSTSPDTLLRLLRVLRKRPLQRPLLSSQLSAATGATGATGGVRVLGVDDFALRRGHTYGTILVDLEKHCLVDLLPDREAKTLAKWLREHPGVEIISRDRGGAYADGARQGAPDAIQVADRWHLMRTLSAALEQVLVKEKACLQEVHAALHPCTGEVEIAPQPNQWEREKAEHREKRLTRYQHLQQMLQEQQEQPEVTPYLTHCQMAQAAGISAATFYRWQSVNAFPERKPLPRRPRQIDPYIAYVKERWDGGCHDGTTLWREIQDQGFCGTYSMVRHVLDEYRARLPAERRQKHKPRKPPPPPSPRQSAWLLLRAPEQLESEQRAFVEALVTRCVAVQQAQQLTQSFFALVRERRTRPSASAPSADLEAWLMAAQASGLPEFVTCSHGLSRDKAAVLAGLSLEWSNGQTEGQVNRLKLVKRSMYGRAGFDLLQARVLAAH